MAFADFEATDWTTGDEITAALMDELEKRAMGARATVKVRRANNITGQSGGAVAVIDWEAEYWDNDDMWDASSPSDPVTVVQAGIYLITAQVAFTGNSATNNTYMSLELNSSTATFGAGTVLGFHTGTAKDTTPSEFFSQVNAIADLSGSDFVELKCMADTGWGIDANVYGDAGDGCWMSMTMIARNPTAS